MKKIHPPDIKKLNDYYRSYWKYLTEDDLMAALEKQHKETMVFLSAIPKAMEDHAYASGKWMLKEVVGHLSDAERILSYRALRFSRNDNTPLAPFDENNYSIESNYRNISLKEIAEEWSTVRAATISLFSTMSMDALDRTGVANETTVSPRILLYFIIMHARHHLEILKERYLNSALSA